jgi:uncharacterized protein (TIGR03437 family)
MFGTLSGSGVSGVKALAQYAPNAVVTNNVMVGGDSTKFDASTPNYFPAKPANVGFLNYPGGDYRLLGASPYMSAGTDQQKVGADIISIVAATAGVISGVPVPSQPPAAASVLNAASLLSGPLAPGSIVSIFGANFSTVNQTASSAPLPTILGDVFVTINGLPAPLLVANGGQITAQVPFEAQPGTASVVVSSAGVAGAPVSFPVAPAAPGLYTNGDNTRAMASNPDATLNSSSNPVSAGGLLTVHLTGQGALNPPVPTGTAAAAQPLSMPALPVSVTVGGQAAQIIFAGATPGTVGVFQVDLTVPSLTPGDYPVIVSVGGTTSNSGLISIK